MKSKETAIDLFNKALKKLILLDINPSKENGKILCLMEIESIKEALYNIYLIDGTPVSHYKKTFNFYQKVKNDLINL